MKLNKYEHESLKEIKKWEKLRHEGFHKKILDVTSKPVEYLIKKIGPEKFEKFGNAIEKTVKKLLSTSTYSVNTEILIKRAHDHGIKIKDLSELKKCNLELLDRCNRENINFHKKASAIQGAVLGFGGGIAAIADLTTLLIQDFHMIQEIVFCHAYDPNDMIEKEIILRVIEAAIGGSEIKFKALKEIEYLKNIKKKHPGEKITQKGVSVLGAKAMEEYIENLTVALLTRLIKRAIPVISIVVSAHSNLEIIEHSGNTAFMVYRKRFLERKKRIKPVSQKCPGEK